MDAKLETVELGSSRSLNIVHYQCRSFQENHDWHYHPEYELAYILKGSGVQNIGDSIEQFSAGDLVFIGPNVPHCWTSSDDGQQCEMLVLQFNLEYIGESLLESPEAWNLKQLIDKSKRGISFHGSSAKELLSQLSTVEHASRGLKQMSSFLCVLDSLCECHDYRLLSSDCYSPDESSSMNIRIDKVVQYVKKNLSSEIKQTTLADLVCMTPQSFSRYFKASTGKTFVSFVNSLRISEACKLLVNTNKDIIDIAFECGYSNLSNFNRRFVNIKNITPRAYRKEYLRKFQSVENIAI